MAPKKHPDDKLAFLYLCLKSSNYTSIDFKAVADAMSLKQNAAQMRFYRIKKQMEGSNAGEAGDPDAADESGPATSTKPAKTNSVKSPKRSVEKTSGRKPATKRKKTAEPNDGDEDELAEAAEQE